MNENKLEILNYIEESAMIDLDDVRNQMNIKKKEAILHKYTRIESGKAPTVVGIRTLPMRQKLRIEDSL